MPAPGGWFTCLVTQAGPAEDGQIYIRLTDRAGAFNERWFEAYEGKRKEMLAVALVAITTGYPVVAWVASTDELSQLNRLYVLNEPALRK